MAVNDAVKKVGLTIFESYKLLIHIEMKINEITFLEFFFSLT